MKSTLLFPLMLLLGMLVACEDTTEDDDSYDSQDDDYCKITHTGDVSFRNGQSSTIVVTIKGESKSIEPGDAKTFSSISDGTCSCTVEFDGETINNVEFETCVEECETIYLKYGDSKKLAISHK